MLSKDKFGNTFARDFLQLTQALGVIEALGFLRPEALLSEGLLSSWAVLGVVDLAPSLAWIEVEDALSLERVLDQNDFM